MTGSSDSGTMLVVNGRRVVLSSPKWSRLVHALRDELGLLGTKVGCETGQCGACTVLISGEPACACLMAVGQAEGQVIETVESLHESGELRPIQESFARHGAIQCGYCASGILVSSAWLLRHKPRPDHAAVKASLAGVLCRCTGYAKIVEAVVTAHEPRRDTPALSSPGSLIGARVQRVDDALKLSGQLRFGGDWAPDDALWLRVIRAPFPRGRFSFGDLAGWCDTQPGLVAVLTHRDIPGSNRYGIYPDLKDQPVLSEGEVRYRGEAVLALVGERAAIESIVPDTIPIEWTAEEPILSAAQALARDAALVHPLASGNILCEGRLENTDDIEEMLELAPISATAQIATSRVEHAYLEPEAGCAFLIEGGTRIEIHACTQSPYMDRDEISRVLGVAPECVRIRPTACGGGFGGKLDLSVQPLLACAAWRLRRPVRWTFHRAESMEVTTKRHPAQITARAAATADGRLLGFDLAADFDTGAYASWGPTVAGRVPIHATGPYRIEHVRVRSRAIYTNHPPSGAFRGFGVPQVALVHEQLCDSLAEKLGMDPMEFRVRNALRGGDTLACGQRLGSSVGMLECLQALEDDWRRLRASAEAFNRRRPGALRRGVGVACAFYGCGNTAMPNPSTMRVSLSRSGVLTFWNGAVDIGQGSSTTLLQICAAGLGIGPAQIRVCYGDTDRTADAGKTSASRQTFVSGQAALRAALDLRRQLLALARANDEACIAVEPGLVTVVSNGATRTLALESLPVIAAPDIVLEGKGYFDPPTSPLNDAGLGEPYATYAFGAQLAHVSVDTDTGSVRVLEIIAAHDVGRAINPSIVEGQIEGAIAQGLGMALMERYEPGRSCSFREYLIPTVYDMPAIRTILVEERDPLGPFGAKGIGEPALIPTAPAILGAVRHATGAILTHVPVLPRNVLAAISVAESRAAEEVQP